MLSLSPAEMEKKQQVLVRQCERRVFDLLDQGRDIFAAMFPQAVVKSKEAAQSTDANKVLNFKLNQMKKWVRRTLMDAVAVAKSPEPLDIVPESIRLPPQANRDLLKFLVKIFTAGRDLNDNDYYYISDVTNSLGLEAAQAQKIIDQAQYEIRKDFFEVMKNEFDEEQCFQCAVLLLRAIRADDHVHPAEFRYIENISQLLKHDQAKIEEVEAKAEANEELPRVFLTDEFALYMFKYLTEVVMCDGEYDARESQFLQKIGKALGYDKHKQDSVIQPVASAMMVKAALFPKA